MQRYSGGNAEALAAVRDGSRTVGMLYAYDTWTVAVPLRLEFGARYANYGYLEDQGLWSPRAGIEVKPLDDPLKLRASVAHREDAPGAPKSSSRRQPVCGCRRNARSQRCRGVASSARSVSITSRWPPSAP